MDEKQILTNQPSMNDLYRLVIESITDTAWIASMDYHLMWVSPSVSRQRGYSSEELMQIPLKEQMTELSFVQLQSFITSTLKTSQSSQKLTALGTLELELFRKDGSSFWSEEKISILFRSENKPIHFLGIGRDISNRKKTEQELTRSEQLYHNLFEYFPTGMYRTTPEGRILEVNPALVAMLKADNVTDVIGRNAREFFVNPEDRQIQQKLLEDESKLLQSVLHMKCFDGSIILVRDNARAVRDIEGNVQFYEGSLEDITKERKAENALRESEERYRTLVANMSEGLTIVDTNEKVLFSNSTADEMFGVKTGTMVGRNLKEFLDPKQYQSVRQQTFNRMKGERSSYEIEIKRPDGQTRNLQVTATPQMNEKGEIISSFGVVHDITQRRKNELVIQQTQAQLAQQLHENEQRRQELDSLSKLGNALQTCSDISGIIKVLIGYIGKLFHDCSGAFFVLDESESKFRKSLAWGLLGADEASIPIDACWSLRLQPPQEFLKVSTDPNPFCQHVLSEKTLPFNSHCIPVLVGEKPFGMLHVESSKDQGLITDVQHKISLAVAEQLSLVMSNILLRESLRQQAIRDPLTGLYNRYYLEETLKNELERARRGNYSLGMIMLDFDNFKDLNTNCGHPKVDEMLKMFGNMVRSEFRASDICCRYGGDEFIMMIPEASSEVTYARAELLLNLVKQLKISKNKKTYPVTISAGVAIFPNHGQTADALLNSVDEALLTAKLQHDCVFFAKY